MRLLGINVVLLVSGFGLLAGLSQSVSATEVPTRKLVILTWSDYMEPELIKKFEAKYNAHVTEVYFESDDMRQDMLLETDTLGYDVVMVSGSSVEPYRKRGWLTPLNTKQIPNRKHIYPKWLTAYAGTEAYGVPFFWGTVGIAYRKDLVAKPITSWKDLYKPAEELQGKIVMIKDSRDVIGMALKALGYSANSADKNELDAAEELLLDQKSHVKSYSYVALNKESVLYTGEGVAAMAYNGDALALKELHPDIAFVVPTEGCALWVDYLTIMSASKNKLLAHKFINFLNDASNAKRLAEYVYYATPNKAAEKLLSAEFLNDAVIYPDTETLSRCEFYTPLPARAIKTRNTIFTRVIQ
jgi:spermidine/putrescine transport system substrate-binding protein